MDPPDRQQLGRKVWTRGEIAQELINYGRIYGPVNRPYQRVEIRAVRVAEQGSKRLFSSGKSPDLAGKGKPLNQQGLWQLGLQKGIPRDLVDGLLTKKLERLCRDRQGEKSLLHQVLVPHPWWIWGGE